MACKELCSIGSYVAEGCVYLLSGDILITSAKYNPLIRDAHEAAREHKKGNEYTIDRLLAKTLKSHAETNPKRAIESGVLHLPATSIKRAIPLEELDSEPLTNFLFRDAARPYADFLRGHGQHAVRHWSVPPQYLRSYVGDAHCDDEETSVQRLVRKLSSSKRKQTGPGPFLRAIWLHPLSKGSDIVTMHSDISQDDGTLVSIVYDTSKVTLGNTSAEKSDDLEVPLSESDDNWGHR